MISLHGAAEVGAVGSDPESQTKVEVVSVKSETSLSNLEDHKLTVEESNVCQPPTMLSWDPAPECFIMVNN